MPTLPDETWRVTTAGRILAAAVALGWLVLAVAATTAWQASPIVVGSIWVGFLALTLGAWRWAFVPRITLTPDAVEVVNWLSRTRLPYGEIAAARVAFNGITMTTRDGARRRAWAIQKSTILQWAGKQTVGDEVVAAIMTRVSATA